MVHNRRTLGTLLNIPSHNRAHRPTLHPCKMATPQHNPFNPRTKPQQLANVPPHHQRNPRGAGHPLVLVHCVAPPTHPNTCLSAEQFSTAGCLLNVK